MPENAVLGCNLSKNLSFSQDEELYIATSDTKIKMKNDYAPFVDKILTDISYVPNKVLDLGCGPGYITRRINEVLPNCFALGVDKSATMINHANKVLRRRLEGDCAFQSGVEINGTMHAKLKDKAAYLDYCDFRIKYIIADSVNLPFGNFSFDLIILKGTFKCLDDKLNSLKEIYRVLSYGGEVFIYEFRKDIPEDEFNLLTKDMKPQKVNLLKRKLNCSLDIPEYEKYLFEAGLAGCSEIKTDGLDLKIRISKNC